MARKNTHKYTSNFTVKDGHGKKWRYSGGDSLTFHGDFRAEGLVNLIEKNKIQNIRYYNGSALSDVPYRHIRREYPHRASLRYYGSDWGADDPVFYHLGDLRKLYANYDRYLPKGLVHTGETASLSALRISQGDGVVFEPGNAIVPWEKGGDWKSFTIAFFIYKEFHFGGAPADTEAHHLMSFQGADFTSFTSDASSMEHKHPLNIVLEGNNITLEFAHERPDGTIKRRDYYVANPFADNSVNQHFETMPYQGCHAVRSTSAVSPTYNSRDGNLLHVVITFNANIPHPSDINAGGSMEGETTAFPVQIYLNGTQYNMKDRDSEQWYKTFQYEQAPFSDHANKTVSGAYMGWKNVAPSLPLKKLVIGNPVPKGRASQLGFSWDISSHYNEHTWESHGGAENVEYHGTTDRAGLQLSNLMFWNKPLDENSVRALFLSWHQPESGQTSGVTTLSPRIINQILDNQPDPSYFVNKHTTKSTFGCGSSQSYNPAFEEKSLIVPDVKMQSEQITIFTRNAKRLIGHLTFTITGNDGIKSKNFILVSSEEEANIPAGVVAIDFSKANPRNFQSPYIIAKYIAQAIATSINKEDLGIKAEARRNRVILTDVYKTKIKFKHTNASSAISYVEYTPPRSRISANKVQIGYTYKTAFHFGTGGTLTGIGAANDNVGTVFKATAAGSANDSVVPVGFIPRINRIITDIKGRLFDGNRKDLTNLIKTDIISGFSNIPTIVHGLNVNLNPESVHQATLGIHEAPDIASPMPVSQGSVFSSGIDLTKNDEKMSPYIEDGLYAVFGSHAPDNIIDGSDSIIDKDSVGLYSSDFGRRYSGRLRDKESIQIELNNSQAITLATMGRTDNPDRSTMAYISPKLGKWKHLRTGDAAGSRRGSVYNTFSGGSASIKTASASNWWPYTSVSRDIAVAGHVGFSPSQLNITKLSYVLSESRKHNLTFDNALKGRSQEFIDQEIADNMTMIVTNTPMTPINSLGFPSHTKYTGNSDTAISMKDYIDRPFMVERIVFETDVSFAGAGRMWDGTVYTDSSGREHHVYTDIMPAGLTFFLLNQIKGSPSRKAKRHMSSETLVAKRNPTVPFNLSEIINQTDITDVYLPVGPQKAWDLSSRPSGEQFPHPQIWPPSNDAGGTNLLSHATNNGWSFMQAKVVSKEIGNAHANNTASTNVIVTSTPWTTSKYFDKPPEAFRTAAGGAGYSIAIIKQGYMYEIHQKNNTTNSTWTNLGADGSPSNGEKFIAAKDYDGSTDNTHGAGTIGKVWPVTGATTSGVDWVATPGILGGGALEYNALYHDIQFNSNSLQSSDTNMRSLYSASSYLTSDKPYRVRMLLKTTNASDNEKIRITVYATYIDEATESVEYPGNHAVGRVDALSSSWEWIDIPIFTYDQKGRKFNLTFVPEWIGDTNSKNETATEVAAGSFVTGQLYRIKSVGTTTWTSIGADSSAPGAYFKATGAGSGTGVATIALDRLSIADGLYFRDKPSIDIASATMYETEDIVKADTFRDLIGYATVGSIHSDFISNEGTYSGRPLLGTEKLSSMSKKPKDLYDIALKHSSAKKKLRVSVPCRTPIIRDVKLLRSYDPMNAGRVSDYYEQDLVVGWNSISRSGVDGFSSGRSPLGREIGSFEAAFKTMNLGWPTTIDRYTFPGQKYGMFSEPNRTTQVSPYLLYPEDNIIVGVQNGTSDYMTKGPAGKNSDATEPTNAFDPSVTLEAGSVRVKLYGSYLKQGFPDANMSTKDNLNSKSVHESIGNYPVEDQNDTASKAQLRNSYIDRVFYGNPSLTENPRGKEISRLGLVTRHPGRNFVGPNRDVLEDSINPMGQMHPYFYRLRIESAPVPGFVFEFTDHSIIDETYDSIDYKSTTKYVAVAHNASPAGGGSYSNGEKLAAGDRLTNGGAQIAGGDPRIGAVVFKVKSDDLYATHSNLAGALQNGNNMQSYSYPYAHAGLHDRPGKSGRGYQSGKATNTKHSFLTLQYEFDTNLAITNPKTTLPSGIRILPFVSSDEKADEWVRKFNTTEGACALSILDSANVVTAGSFVTNTTYEIVSVENTNFTSIGAASNTVGVTFKASGAGSGTGTARAVFITLERADKTTLSTEGYSSRLSYLKAANLFTRHPNFNRGIVAKASDNGTFITGSMTRFVKAVQENDVFYYDSIMPTVYTYLTANDVKVPWNRTTNNRAYDHAPVGINQQHEFALMYTGSFLPIFQRAQITNGAYGEDLSSYGGKNSSNINSFKTTYHGLRTLWSRFPLEKKLERTIDATLPNTMRCPIAEIYYDGSTPSDHGLPEGKKGPAQILRINVPDVNIQGTQIIKSRRENGSHVAIEVPSFIEPGYMVIFTKPDGTEKKIAAVTEAFYKSKVVSGDPASLSSTASEYVIANADDPMGTGAINNSHYLVGAYMFPNTLTDDTLESFLNDSIPEYMKWALIKASWPGAQHSVLVKRDSIGAGGKLWVYNTVDDSSDLTKHGIDSDKNKPVKIVVPATHSGKTPSEITFRFPSSSSYGLSRNFGPVENMDNDGTGGGIGSYSGQSPARIFEGTFGGGGPVLEWSNCHFTASIPGFARVGTSIFSIRPESEIDGFSPVKNENVRKCMLKAVYGFETSFASRPVILNEADKYLNTLYGPVNTNRMQTSELPGDTHYGFGPGDAVHSGHFQIRGFKYGVMNSWPTKPSIVMNHRSHGQFRDMLEQRIFTTEMSGSVFEHPVTIEFISRRTDNEDPHHGVNPESTNSQNLSYHATSSLPFFDVDGRRTGEAVKRYPTAPYRPFESPAGRDRSSLEPDIQEIIEVGN